MSGITGLCCRNLIRYKLYHLYGSCKLPDTRVPSWILKRCLGKKGLSAIGNSIIITRVGLIHIWTSKGKYENIWDDACASCKCVGAIRLQYHSGAIKKRFESWIEKQNADLIGFIRSGFWNIGLPRSKYI